MAEMTENNRRRILGVVRVSIEPDGKTGEIAFIVADPWQRLGLGTKLVDCAIEICKDMNIEGLFAIMLPDNYRAISLMKKMGFTINYLEDGTARGTLNLKEEELMKCPEPRMAGQPQASIETPDEQAAKSEKAEVSTG